ncbi:hypothetical protein EMPG_13452 [Blastomyces silverae]|uniref:Uncharacterized protein n=1 Tax=Blastomyces silverae TaxID=2060906 RepID=A0A0H1BIB5_9EURO|nr:hypothetical protein EMPG_13452 [Blastomyces silverae]
MLLLLNEMDVLLRVALRPGNAQPVAAWWSFPYEFPPDYGWAELMRTALMAYICLNVLYVMEERKVVENSSDKDKETDTDYRQTAAYQMMICRVTGSRAYDVHTYPHRGFFGVGEDMYSTNDWRDNPLYGRASLATLRQRWPASIHIPSSADFYTALHYLNIKGLPTELGMMVLEFANYEPHHRAIVHDDPLHIENAAELRKYLSFCWQLLVRCDVLAKACGKRVDWVGEVTQCIFHLFGVKYPKMFDFGVDNGFNDEFRDWKGNEIERCWIKFV